MGYVRHDAVIVTMPGSILTGDYARGQVPVPDIEGFRASLPEDWRPLLVGPAHSVVNDICIVAFLPDGSKEGWDDWSFAWRVWRIAWLVWGLLRELFTVPGFLRAGIPMSRTRSCFKAPESGALSKRCRDPSAPRLQ